MQPHGTEDGELARGQAPVRVPSLLPGKGADRGVTPAKVSTGCNKGNEEGTEMGGGEGGGLGSPMGEKIERAPGRERV